MWTIIVNNSGCTTSGNTITCSDLGGEKVTDALQTDGVDIQGDVVDTGREGGTGAGGGTGGGAGT